MPPVAPRFAGVSATHSPLQFGFLVAALSRIKKPLKRNLYHNVY